MKRLAGYGAAISLLLVGSALAADMPAAPARTLPPAAPPVAAYNFTGCYVGAGGGFAMFNQDTQLVSAGVPVGLSNTNGGRGYFGTVQVGCDYQVSSNLVIGAFADYSFGFNIEGDMAIPAQGVVGEEKLKWWWAAGGRVGWLVQPYLMAFVSGGYTQATFDQVDLLFAANGAPAPSALPKHTYSGWFVGTGYEYAMRWMPGLFWKAEYRFADYSADLVPLVPSGLAVDLHKYVHAVRSQIIWRFNWSGPVVARY